MGFVFRAVLICGEPECAEAFEAYGPLEELEALACECGCTLELIEISDTDDPAPAAGFALTPLG